MINKAYTSTYIPIMVFSLRLSKNNRQYIVFLVTKVSAMLSWMFWWISSLELVFLLHRHNYFSHHLLLQSHDDSLNSADSFWSSHFLRLHFLIHSSPSQLCNQISKHNNPNKHHVKTHIFIILPSLLLLLLYLPIQSTYASKEVYLHLIETAMVYLVFPRMILSH